MPAIPSADSKNSSFSEIISACILAVQVQLEELIVINKNQCVVVHIMNFIPAMSRIGSNFFREILFLAEGEFSPATFSSLAFHSSIKTRNLFAEPVKNCGHSVVFLGVLLGQQSPDGFRACS